MPANNRLSGRLAFGGTQAPAAESGALSVFYGTKTSEDFRNWTSDYRCISTGALDYIVSGLVGVLE
jgi:hypothetical protein